MEINDQEKLDKIRNHVKKIEYLRFTNNALLYWDKTTKMPPKGIEFRSEVMSFMAGEIHELSQNDELINLVKYFEQKDPDDLSIETNAMVRKIMRNHHYTSKIPVDEYQNYIYLISEAEDVWAKCKSNSDFNTLEPILENVVKHFQKTAKYWGYENEPYDALLSYYEEGISTKVVDDMFTEIRVFIVGFLKQIRNKELMIDQNIFRGVYPKNKQADMTVEILKKIGFDFNAGRLDEGIHPTILANSNKDVRIVASYQEDDFRPAFTTALHEGGQGLYEQGISSNLYGTFLAESSSMAMLEAIANFYENIFGKSKEFLEYFYPTMQGYFPSLKNKSCEEFYIAINEVSPSFIRMDADELTYNLHIIIRYEIEKDLMSGKIKVKDIPNVWNKKYKDYLGIEPPNNKLGVLQDIHWFSGYWGYFPIYILGNLYAAQIYNKLQSDIPDYKELVRTGRWEDILEWFKEKIFIHGSTYNSQELIYLITDEKLNSDYFIKYLREKYTDIYNL